MTSRFTTIIRKKSVITLLLALFVIGGVFASRDIIGEFVWEHTKNDKLSLVISRNDPALKLTIANYYFNEGAYDLDKAEKYYSELLVSGVRSYLTLYQLGRIHFVNNRLVTALNMFNRQLELYPDEKRAYYMLGLTNLYIGDFQNAIADFESFVAWAPEEWAGYNDLSWAYFKNGEYQASADAALQALELFPDNLWLHNMAGVALWNLGELEDAEWHLEETEKAVQTISVSEWGGAYPGNDPATYETSLETMRAAVSSNLAGVRQEMNE